MRNDSIKKQQFILDKEAHKDMVDALQDLHKINVRDREYDVEEIEEIVQNLILHIGMLFEEV